MDMLASLFLEAGQMRFLLSITLELGSDPERQSVLYTLTNGLSAEISTRMGRSAEDTIVRSFLDELPARGKAFMFPPLADDGQPLIRASAERRGLSPPMQTAKPDRQRMWPIRDETTSCTMWLSVTRLSRASVGTAPHVRVRQCIGRVALRRRKAAR